MYSSILSKNLKLFHIIILVSNIEILKCNLFFLILEDYRAGCRQSLLCNFRLIITIINLIHNPYFNPK